MAEEVFVELSTRQTVNVPLSTLKLKLLEGEDVAP